MSVSRVALACALAALTMVLPARAAITCTVSVTSMSIVYDPLSASNNVTTGSYTVSCTRLISDPNTFSWQLGVNNGLHAAGGSNRVQNASNQRYNYDTYRLSPYVAANLWADAAATRFVGTLSFGAATSASVTAPFDIMMPALQTAQPAGTYTDTVTARLRNAAGTLINTSTFGVIVLTTTTCQLSVPPGNVNFTYTSFQGAAATASTNFGVRCTTTLPYTMALDLTSGTVLNLNYTLALSSASGTGNGATQTYTINGSMAAGQSGTCATALCTGSATRTLTLSW